MKVWGKRAMLNLPGHHSTGSIVAEVAQNEYGWGTMLAISDCSHTIQHALYGPAGTEAEFANDPHKIDTMVDALRELRKGLLRARRQVQR